MEMKGVTMDGPASCNAGSEAVGLLRSGGGGEDDAGWRRTWVGFRGQCRRGVEEIQESIKARL
jgi:hypothetical protein